MIGNVLILNVVGVLLKWMNEENKMTWRLERSRLERDRMRVREPIVGKVNMKFRLDPAAERGIWMGLCFMIVYYTFFSHDYDFGVIQGNPLAYGWLWYLFNPLHNSRLIWGLTT